MISTAGTAVSQGWLSAKYKDRTAEATMPARDTRRLDMACDVPSSLPVMPLADSTTRATNEAMAVWDVLCGSMGSRR